MEKYSRKGFALIELALVLIVAGIFAGSAFLLVRYSLNVSSINETEIKITESIEQFVNISVFNMRFPDSGEMPAVVDSWGSSLVYLPAQNGGTPGDLCVKSSDPITVRECSVEDCSEYRETRDAAAVFISPGGDRIMQTEVAGSTVIIPAQGGVTGGRPSDDIAGWISYSELKGRADCTSGGVSVKRGSPPTAYHGSYYEAVFNAEGFPAQWCASSADPELASLLSIPVDCSSPYGWQSGTSLVLSGYYTMPEGSSSVHPLSVCVRDSFGHEDCARFVVEGHRPYEIPPEGAREGFGEDSFVFMDRTGEDSGEIFYETDNDKLNLPAVVMRKDEDSPNTSLCSWSRDTYMFNSHLRLYYKFAVSPKDTDPFSEGTETGGLSLLFYDSGLTPGEDFTCGTSGDTGIYGLTAGPDSFALEHDMRPTYLLDYRDMEAKPSNHTAFIPCNVEYNGEHLCLPAHTIPEVPSCPGTACYEGETATWTEDEGVHSVRVELRKGYNGDCTSPGTNGMLFLAWVDCTRCSDTSIQFNGSPPMVKTCIESPPEGVGFGFAAAVDPGGEVITAPFSFDHD